MTFQERYDTYKALTEERLAALFPGKGLEEAMRYSLLAGGKRLRAALCMAFCEAAGGKAQEALDFACGVEMFHTYSLIHDDLPCMDNDDLRRGKPTNHKVFGEAVAVVAGDALQAAAFQTILSSPGPWLREAAPLMAARALAEAAGEKGMCLGQYLDITGDGCAHSEEELTKINDAKTGDLFRAACRMGVIASTGHRQVDGSCLDAACHYAAALGLAFQIQDDILDVTGTAEALGKTIGSDKANQKATFVTLLGVEGSRRRVLDYTEQAISALEKAPWNGDLSFLISLARQLAERIR